MIPARLCPMLLRAGVYLAFAGVADIYRQLYVAASDRPHMAVAAGDRHHLNVVATAE